MEQNLGTIVLNIDMNALVKSCTNFEKQYGETEYLILQDDALLYHTGNLSLEDTETAAVKSIERYSPENINGTQYFISHGSIEEYGWDYYCLVSYCEKIAKQLRQIRKVCPVDHPAGCSGDYVADSVHDQPSGVPHQQPQRPDAAVCRRQHKSAREYLRLYRAQRRTGSLNRQFDEIEQKDYQSDPRKLCE